MGRGEAKAALRHSAASGFAAASLHAVSFAPIVEAFTDVDKPFRTFNLYGLRPKIPMNSMIFL